MAGRGRNATLPAWMTQPGDNAQFQQINSNPNNSSNAIGNNSSSSRDHRENDKGNNGYVPRDIEKGRGLSEREKHNDIERGRDRDRDRDRHRDVDKDRRSRSRDKGNRRRSRSRSSSRQRRKRDRSPSEHVPKWKSKSKQSNFDVKPPDGVVLPPIGGILSGESFVGGPVGGPGIQVRFRSISFRSLLMVIL